MKNTKKIPRLLAACPALVVPVRFGLLILVPAAGILLSSACGSPRASIPRPLDGAPAAAPAGLSGAADVAMVRRGPAEDVFILTGELRSIHSLDLVTPRSEAWQVQIKWLAEDGSEVREGDRVVEFDNSSIVQGIDEKKLRVIQSEIDITSREAALTGERQEKRSALDSARCATDRARIEAAVPPDLRQMREWQEKQAALSTAEAAEQKARLELESFEVSASSDLEVLRIARDKAAREIESAEGNLQSLALAAPRSGILVVNDNWREERKYQVGDTLWPGLAVASIPDLSEMEVVASLPEVDEGRIASGMKTRCILDTYPDRVFEGRVESVAAIADEPGQRTRGGFRVHVSLSRSDPALMRPGMSARIEVVRREWDTALTVPRRAVRFEGGTARIAKTRGRDSMEVRVAGCTPTDCIVESGLSEGERVELR